jgi:hypothetical protein
LTSTSVTKQTKGEEVQKMKKGSATTSEQLRGTTNCPTTFANANIVVHPSHQGLLSAKNDTARSAL